MAWLGLGGSATGRAMGDTRRHLLPLAVALGLLALLVAAGSSAAQTIETQAREAILIDATTGSVLFERRADERMPTASMSKIMTMYMVFEAIQEDRLSLDDYLEVSERAWRMGGSRMFVEVGDQVRVEDLIRGVIVQSGNDASVVLAEALAGTEEEFARQMTQRAQDLGMTGSRFANATGWPNPDHYSTARDLATLAQNLIETFPEFYHYYSERSFQYGVGLDGEPMEPQLNRNPLLGRLDGADGLKTGHTEEAGYGLTASAVRGDRRLVLVVNGLSSTRARSEEAARLLEWGFREFESTSLFRGGEVIETAQVWMGEHETVPLVLTQDLDITLRRAALDDLRVVVRVDEPVPAPIVAGERPGNATLVITAPGTPTREVPLVAGAAIEEANFFGRIAGALEFLVRDLL